MQRMLIWSVIAAVVFTIFYLLFRLGLPDAAFKFALGTTIIIMSGLLTGSYVAYAWTKADRAKHNVILFLLSIFTLICIVLIGVFVNRMIQRTTFNYFLFTVLCLFLMSAFISAFARTIRNRLKNNLRLAKAALTQSQAEMQALQSQLSPHFLFNTLNNLYGLSITNPEKVPPLILRLSDLLRFSIYEAKDIFIPLADEIAYLKNYIEFEKIRMGERLQLSVHFEDSNEKSVRVPSMLFIVFLENAFKHSRNDRAEKVQIETAIKTKGEIISFDVTNSYDEQSTNEFMNTHSGFGLESVKKRLNLLYPGKHDLRITKTDKAFHVHLELNTK